MAINLSRAWTASSLVPANGPIGTAAASSLPSQVSLGNNNFASILANVLGNSGIGGNLLNSGTPAVGAPQGDNSSDIMAKAYAQNLRAKTDAINLYASQQQALQNKSNMLNQYPTLNPQAALNAQVDLAAPSSTANAARISEAAALSPTYAPQLQQSLGSQNNGLNWNSLFGGGSGWISPVQSPRMYSSVGSSRPNLMQLI